MAGPLQAIVQQDLSRGSNAITNPWDLGAQQSVLVKNLILDEHGTVRTRDGTLIVTTSPDADPNIRPIVKLFDFIRQDGTVFPLAIVKGPPGDNQLYNRGTTPWTLIGTLGTQFEIPDILSFVNLALIANGYEVPWSYDGTTLQHLVGGSGTVPAGAKHHALHQGYYWVWNTAPEGTGPTAPTNATATTALAGANNDLRFTAVVAGSEANGISVRYSGGLGQSLGVEGNSRNIVVQLETTALGVVLSTAQEVMDILNTTPLSADVFTTSLAPGNDGTGVVDVMAAIDLTGGSEGGTTGFDGPSSLRSSDLNNPDSWPEENQIFIDKDDGDQGMGLGHFTIAESGISPTTSLIVFKTFAAYQMTGVFGSETPLFAIQKIKSDMGCIAPRTIRFCPGIGLVRLTHRGFALFDGVQDTLISTEVAPLIFGSTIYVPIDWEFVLTAYATVVPNPPCYICAVPICDAPGLTRVFCFDLIRRAWTILEYPEAIATLATILDPGQIGT